MHIKPEALSPIHFVGIGGIGMSGIAEVLHNLGYPVQGSDSSENNNVKRLKALGIKTFIGHTQKNVQGASVVVVSTAISADNPEVQAAYDLNIPVIRRADMLAELMRLKPSVAVTGTHGKTTTTSLVAAVLEKAGLDPTVINGGIINSYGTNAYLGQGEWLVAEADESDGSFTRLPHTIAIVTNIESDHMDHYASFQEIKDTFDIFIRNLPFYGLGIICLDNEASTDLFHRIKERRLISYGLSTSATVFADNIRYLPNGMLFDVHIQARARHILSHPELKDSETIIRDISLPMIGDHNVSNAVAALIVGLKLQIPLNTLQSAFTGFQGVKRRFTVTGHLNGFTIVDDYAHHPTEIRKVLEAAKHNSTDSIIAVIQPHRFTRLEALFDDFAGCFDLADRVVIAPVYGAGEKPIKGITHQELAEAVKRQNKKQVDTIGSYAELVDYVKNLKEFSKGYIVCMGAGDITQWANQLPLESLNLKTS